MCFSLSLCWTTFKSPVDFGGGGGSEHEKKQQRSEGSNPLVSQESTNCSVKFLTWPSMRAGDTAEEKRGLPFFQLCSSLVLLTGWASHSASEWQGCVLLLSMVSEEAVQSSAAQAGCRQGRGAENILILVKRSYLGQRLGCVPRGYKTTQGCFFFPFYWCSGLSWYVSWLRGLLCRMVQSWHCFCHHDKHCVFYQRWGVGILVAVATRSCCWKLCWGVLRQLCLGCKELSACTMCMKQRSNEDPAALAKCFFLTSLPSFHIVPWGSLISPKFGDAGM